MVILVATRQAAVPVLLLLAGRAVTHQAAARAPRPQAGHVATPLVEAPVVRQVVVRLLPRAALRQVGAALVLPQAVVAEVVRYNKLVSNI